jgi:hypothetical protein
MIASLLYIYPAWEILFLLKTGMYIGFFYEKHFLSSCDIRCITSSDFAKNSFAFASGDPLHSNAFLPCAALAFLVTTAN